MTVVGSALVARCRRCDGAVPLPSASRRAVDTDRDDPRVDETWRADAFRLRLTPQRWGAAPLVFFAVVWNLFLFGWYRVAVLAPGPLGVALWFPLLHVAVGVAVAYEALAVLFNHAAVELTRSELRAGHAPLPRFGAIRRPTAGIEGFDPAPRRGALGLQVGFDAFAPLRWTVAVRTTEGRLEPLPLSLPTEAAARRLADRLEDALRTLRTPAGYRA